MIDGRYVIMDDEPLAFECARLNSLVLSLANTERHLAGEARAGEASPGLEAPTFNRGAK